MTDIIENKNDLSLALGTQSDLKTCEIKENRQSMSEEKNYFIVNQLSDKMYIQEIIKHELNNNSKFLQEMVDKFNKPNFEGFTQKQLYYINRYVKDYQYCKSFFNNNIQKIRSIKKKEFRDLMISLYNQFKDKKYLSEKQINVLKNFR